MTVQNVVFPAITRFELDTGNIVFYPISLTVITKFTNSINTINFYFVILQFKIINYISRTKLKMILTLNQ